MNAPSHHTSVPPLTIGMPVCNDKTYVRSALNDLLDQSFTEFELIISDNASTDGTSEICQELAAKDGRIHYIRQEKNIGAAANFIFVLREARGEFFMWAASDDRWHKDFAACLVAALRNDKDLAVAFSPFQYIDEDGRTTCAPKRLDFSGSRPATRLLKLNMTLDPGADAFWYGIFRREIIGDLRVRPWRGINANVPVNTAYPTLSYCLARGGYVSVGDTPMWLNRLYVRRGVRGSQTQSARNERTALLHLFSFILRKIDVAWYNLEEIHRGRRSLGLVLVLFPVIALHCIADILAGGFRRVRAGIVNKLNLDTPVR